MVVYKVPVASQWNNASIDTVTPDGGFVYTGAKSINYIGPIADRKQQAVIKTINTRQSILSLDVDPGWAAEPPEVPKKYVAVLAYDNSVQIWDLDLELAICGHKVHQYAPGIVEYAGPGGADFNQNRIVALLSFMKNRNVLSLDENNLVNYCIASNTYQNMPNFIQKRNQRFSALRCSPYDEEIFAVGTNRGSVYLCNLKKSQVVYTLRGHDTIITCMKFICTETYSLEQLKQQIHAQHQRQQQQQDQADHKQHKLQKEQQQKNPKLKQLKGGGNPKGGIKASAPPADQDEIFDIYDYDYLENEFGAPPQQTDEIVSDFVGFEKPQPTAEFDFAEACQNLKHELAAMSIDDQSQEPTAKTGCEVTLEDCKNSNVRYDDTSSCDDDEEEDRKHSSSHKGDAADEAEAGSSLELIEHKSNNSSDEGIGGDEERKCKKQISLQADVHAIGEPIAMDDDGDNCASNAGIDGMSCEPDGAAGERRNSLSNIHVSDVLLATSSLDAQIWLWNIRTGASCDNVQMPGSVQRGKSCHVQACWLNSNNLVATNKNGDLFCYALETPQVHNIKQRYKLKPIKHMFDSHGIVSFDACTGKEIMWTVSRNREIKLESFQTQQLLAKYGCASTNINAIRENPQDMNKVAVGFSDRRFGVIDLSRLEPNTVIISNQSLRIESPIHCVVWSPDGTRLAFGSEEGRIGIADVPRQAHREVIYLNPICGRPVYSMDWHKTDIYVVCNEMIGVYGNDGKKKHPEIIENIKKVSTISIHPAGYLLVGKQTGKLEIYKRHNPGSITSYELLQTLDLAPRYITEISWNPIVSNRFGVVANANYVHILDFNPETGNAIQIHKLMAVDNPKSCNACLRWSNIDPEKFLTCGFDGAVRVWNLKLEGDKKFDFVKYYPCPIVCGIFMPTDENIVICAGKSTSLEMFDLREEKSQAMCKRFRDPLSSVQWAQEAMMCSKPPSTSEKKRMKRQKALAANSAANSAAATVAAGEPKETCSQILMKAEKEDIVVVTVNDQLQQMHIAGEPQTIDEELNVTLKDAGGVYSKNPTSVLCLITREMNKFPLEKLKKLLISRKGPAHSHIDCVLSTKLFGDKELAKKLLVHELENHHASGSKGVQHIFLPQLTQNFKEEILKAITQKKLNEWHVSMAPSVSYNFWQKTAQAFADQLLEQGFTLQAATYLISLHKHSDAITMLTDGKYFKEAMLLARIYLDKDDPLIANIMEKWLAYLDSTGNLFTAAFICALANDSKRCLEIISKVAKRTDDIEEIIKLLKSG